MNNKLAILGGGKLIKSSFSPYRFMDGQERQAVERVMNSGVLSGFLGSWSDGFYGGKHVKAFEASWSEYFDVKHSITVNSATSGLIVALGAIGIEPGDEVIVSTWSMCASATSILIWNAIPVFSDIEKQTFNLDPNKIESAITPYTKAILVPDIFGHAAEIDAIKKIAKAHNLFVIEDCAQSPGAYYHGKKVGTLTDIGVYSLNYHKHIHTGEGGVCVTNDSSLAERMQLIRNHAEAVVEGKGVENLSNMVGFNFRLSELHAAIGVEQLKKLNDAILYRQKCAKQLRDGLNGLLGLRLPVVQPECTHVYYTFPLIVDPSVIGVSRDMLVKAIQAEGMTDIAAGYINIHRYPMYQKKIAFGSKGHPWNMSSYHGDVSYDLGICPVAEDLHDNSFINIHLCLSLFSIADLNNIVRVFHKVWDNIDLLKAYEEEKNTDCVS